MNARVLMYHGLESPSLPSELTDPGDLLYVLSLSTFTGQLDWLARNGWAIASAETLAQGRNVVLTFDDGHVSNHALALPCLHERGLAATFFVTTNWIGTSHHLSEAMLRELAGAGMVIGAHGASHAFLTDLDDAQATTELVSSRERLEQVLGSEVTTMSAPGGRVDLRIARLALAAGYTDLYTSDNQRPFTLPGLRIHGRLALKRTYSAAQFAAMVRDNREPGYLLRRGLRTAKHVLGNERYQAARALALRVLQRVRRR